jgi:serine protein kinase
MADTNLQNAQSIIDRIAGMQDLKEYQELNWEGSFEDYLAIVREDPSVLRTAWQRVYDMILAAGQNEYIDHKKQLCHYLFFDDEAGGGKDAIFGLDVSLMRLVNVFKSAAYRYGSEKRVILLHGPVGSSKSTIARIIKRGLEHYTRTPEGRLFTFEWVIPEELLHISAGAHRYPCPMHEEPLRLIPEEWRGPVLKDLLPSETRYPVRIEGDLDPACRQIFRELMRVYGGDWSKVIGHIRIKRLVLSEKDRIGIGTFQPKDEKNQDSTELTGDINYRKIAEYGSDSDPRAFNFDGEFNIANRGVVEFIEILKLDVAFLYDLLGATQEHKIKPKKVAQTDIDEVIIGHTHEAEYRKLLTHEFMEALRDRTLKVDIPYITRVSEETKIYVKDFNPQKIRGKHIAPHTLEMAATWAVLTRLEEPTKNLTILQKLKLYDGKQIPGFTADNVKELRKETKHEAMEGISPRYIQDKISNALVSDAGESCVNPFMVLNELEGGLRHHSLISSEDQRERYQELLTVVKTEYEDVVKNEVQRAISADESGLKNLFENYLENVRAYVLKEKVKNPYTKEDREPNERLMRSIEEKIEISEALKDDFRREVMNYIAAASMDGRPFDYSSNDRLRRALELKLFEDQKDSIKFSSFLMSKVVDREEQAKFDVIKNRLIRDHGYCEICASNVLEFVSSIFARGDVQGS